MFILTLTLTSDTHSFWHYDGLDYGLDYGYGYGIGDGDGKGDGHGWIE